LPVQAARSVRTADDDLAAQSDRRQRHAPGDPPLTVISPLHSEPGHILVLEAGDDPSGYSSTPTGLRRIDDADLGPLRGQDRHSSAERCTAAANGSGRRPFTLAGS
jgi:hypothetical protein